MSANPLPLWRIFYASQKGYIATWITSYVLMTALAASLFFYELPLPNEKITLSAVEFSASDAETPAAIPESLWQPSSLPDDWRQKKEKFNNGWYRTKITQMPSTTKLWGVFIPALRMNTAVYLNGVLLGDGGRFSEPVTRNWMTPLLFSIPAGLLQPGENTIHIRLKSTPAGTGQLSKIYLGNYKDLLKAYNAHVFYRITCIQVITIILLLIGILIAVLWRIQPQKTYYGYFSLAVIVWGLHNFNIFITNIPFSTHLWDWLTFISIGYYALLSMAFSHRFLHLHRPIIEKTVLFIGLLASIALFFLSDEYFYIAVYYAWYPAIFAVGFYVLAMTCIEAWRRQDTELQLLTNIGITTLLYAAHDILVMHGYAPWQDGYDIQNSAAALLVLFSIILFRRFANSLRKADRLNLELEKRVKESQAVLTKNFDKLRTLENGRILTEERNRLARDIHDGMGSNLISTLSMIETGKANMTDIEQSLRESLNDLRMMLDSMDVTEDDLNTLLGMFRMRITPLLEKNNMVLHWQVSDLSNLPGFGPHEALNVLRILQEAITNTIKHAQANSITLIAHKKCLKDNSATVTIELIDNGQGVQFASSQKNSGHGIKNMQHRATDMGGNLSIQSETEGTRVIITLPILPA